MRLFWAAIDAPRASLHASRRVSEGGEGSQRNEPVGLHGLDGIERIERIRIDPGMVNAASFVCMNRAGCE